jgi:hypothetical protein
MINKDAIITSDLVKLRSLLQRDSKLLDSEIASLEAKIKELSDTLKKAKDKRYLFNVNTFNDVCLQETISAVLSGDINNISYKNKEPVSRMTGIVEITELGYGSGSYSRLVEWRNPLRNMTKEILEGYFAEIEKDNEKELLMKEEEKKKSINDFYDNLL